MRYHRSSCRTRVGVNGHGEDLLGARPRQGRQPLGDASGFSWQENPRHVSDFLELVGVVLARWTTRREDHRRQRRIRLARARAAPRTSISMCVAQRCIRHWTSPRCSSQSARHCVEWQRQRKCTTPGCKRFEHYLVQYPHDVNEFDCQARRTDDGEFRVRGGAADAEYVPLRHVERSSRVVTARETSDNRARNVMCLGRTRGEWIFTYQQGVQPRGGVSRLKASWVDCLTSLGPIVHRHQVRRRVKDIWHAKH